MTSARASSKKAIVPGEPEAVKIYAVQALDAVIVHRVSPGFAGAELPVGVQAGVGMAGHFDLRHNRDMPRGGIGHDFPASACV